jgi:flagellar basal-body rod protein FlgB
LISIYFLRNSRIGTPLALTNEPGKGFVIKSANGKRTLGKFRDKAMTMFSDVFGIHEQALKLRQDRLSLIAQNIANADTPNYQAKDLDFRKIMSQTKNDMRVELDRTEGGHLEDRSMKNANLIFRTPLNPAADGNTVEVHYEQSEFGKESGRYMATLQFIEGRIGSIRRALRGE